MVVLKEGRRPPWVSLGASVWVQIASGNSYTFPLYSPSLKSVLGFNQQQLSFLGVANDIGENVGIFPGLACNKLPPWAILVVGVCASFLGYGVLWLAVSQAVQNLPYWVLWIALCIATHGSAWLGTAVLVTNMRNFPVSRGAVAGILKGYVGLSAAVFTEVYTMALGGSASNLLLLLTLGIPVIGLLMMYFIRPCTPAYGEDSAEHCHSYSHKRLQHRFLYVDCHNDCSFNGSSIDSFENDNVPFESPETRYFYGVVGGDGYTNETHPLLTPSSSTTYLGSFYEPEEIPEVDLLLAMGEGAVKKKRKPRRGEDFTFREAVVKADFWLLWSVYFLGVGSGVTVLNNLAQIGVSLGVNDATVLLSLFSFCNFLGRLGAGVVSEHFVRSKAIPRIFSLAVAQALMVVSFLLYASALSGTLYAATALLGICYGTQFGVMIPTASELFGLKDFGVIFNFMQLGNPVGALVFSSLLASQPGFVAWEL
ncbi:hypothetical protein SASPL_131099 [Salvia splendens]|uniref:Nodulin-like domain-containing protein n=1 Tax=Salvia splendens TaxID=180675 RepID=A0A8X8X6W0_SALSN|nr:hypothetical protein SASPL_131099 [Salvia splendens]